MLLNSQRYLVMGMFVDIPRLQEGHCVLGWCICAVRVWPESPNKPHITQFKNYTGATIFRSGLVLLFQHVWYVLSLSVSLSLSFLCESICDMFFLFTTVLNLISHIWDIQTPPDKIRMDSKNIPETTLFTSGGMAGCLGNICVTPVWNSLACSGLPQHGYGFYTAITIRWEASGDVTWGKVSLYWRIFRLSYISWC